MLAEELDILKIVAQNPVTSQRKIAEQTGISLGQVNFLLKKFAKIGLIKIEAQTSQSLRYNLTPKGFAEKTEKSLQYMKASYSVVAALSSKIKSLAREHSEKGLELYLLGSEDEMMELCRLSLQELHLPYKLGEPASEQQDKAVVFYWEDQKRDPRSKHLCVNLLD